MDKHAYFEAKTEKLNSAQKKSINNLSVVKKKVTRRDPYLGYHKNKYWCPEDKDTYLATDKHIHCKYCYRHGIDDRHDPILFDPKIHEW